MIIPVTSAYSLLNSSVENDCTHRTDDTCMYEGF